MSMFSTPKPPSMPKPKPPETQVQKALSGRRRGTESTIATGGLGVPGPAPTFTPYLT